MRSKRLKHKRGACVICQCECTGIQTTWRERDGTKHSEIVYICDPLDRERMTRDAQEGF